MEEFEQQIKVTFLTEAQELLAATERCFLSLEKNPRDLENLNAIFRLAHNLKGSSGVAGFSDLTDLTHNLESLLIMLRDGKRTTTKRVMDLLLRTNDYLVAAIEKLLIDPHASYANPTLSAELRAALDETHDDDEPRTAPDPASAPTAPEAPALTLTPAVRAKDESIRVSLARIESLLNNVGELSILQAVMAQQGRDMGERLPPLIRTTLTSMSKIIKETQNLSMGLRMLPVKQLFHKMERIVRDTSNALGKRIELHMAGVDTEIDKTVLERLSDPLVHIVRNAVDHGVEGADARLAAGKAPVGRIELSAFHRSGQIVIEVRDDGRGLDAAHLVAKAKAKGLIAEDAELAPQDAYQLIFMPGFSTKDTVTDVSGRGVGMDVVKTNVSALQGQVEIETSANAGSCIRIRLPLTLAIIDGVVVNVAGERYVVPISQVSEFYRPRAADITYVADRAEVLTIRNESMPAHRLAALIRRHEPTPQPTAALTALVVRGAMQKGLALFVDRIVAQQQVVIKPLGRELKGRTGFMGSAVLGDGRPALILDLFELTRSMGRLDTRRTA
jgi:two-component system chemotaxis sensor kinase CheA